MTLCINFIRSILNEIIGSQIYKDMGTHPYSGFIAKSTHSIESTKAKYVRFFGGKESSLYFLSESL
jgi:hypothetical protein